MYGIGNAALTLMSDTDTSSELGALPVLIDRTSKRVLRIRSIRRPFAVVSGHQRVWVRVLKEYEFETHCQAGTYRDLLISRSSPSLLNMPHAFLSIVAHPVMKRTMRVEVGATAAVESAYMTIRLVTKNRSRETQ